MLKKLFLLFIVFNNFLLLSQVPIWHWAKEANSPGMEIAWDASTDINTGDVYVGGSFDNNLSAKYGASFTSSYGQSDGFIAKYNSTGNVLWAIKIGGTDNEEVKSISIDPSGNVYVAGYFKSVADFDPSAASFNLTPTGGAGNADGFLAKYSSSGTFIWAVKFGGTQADDVWRLYSDASNVYIAGQYMSSATFSSTNVTTKSTTASQGQIEFFGAKYDQSGVVQWVVSGGSVKDDGAQDVKADATGVYFIGYFEHNFSIYNATGALASSLNIISPNKPDAFIIKYTQAGVFAWATSAGSSDDDYGFGIAQDASNLYITGSYKNNTINFPGNVPVFTKTNAGGTDFFLAAISKSTGVYQWASSQTGSVGGDEAAYEIETDNTGNLIVAGYFKNNLNYSSYGGPNFTTTGNEDIFVSAFNPAGNFLYSLQAGANGIDIPYGLATHTTGAIYIAGEHAGATTFGSNVLTPGAGKNVFVAKTGCELILNNTATANQTICTGNAPSTLAGSLPTGGTGTYTYTWEQSTNSTTWTAATGINFMQNYSPSPLTVTMYYRRLVSAGGSCISSQSNTLQITVTPLPTTANAGTNQTICATTVTLSGNTPAVGSGSWTVSSGGGSISSPASATTGATGLTVGINKFVWTISNGVCPSSTSTVTITRDNVPTVSNAGSNQSVCATNYTLNANSPAIGIGAWSVASGTGTFTAASNPTSAVNGISTGANNYVWTISNGTCPSSTSTVTITRDNFPTVSNAGTNQTICATGYGLNANTPVVGNGAWSLFSGTGSFVLNSNPTSSVNGISVGTNKYVWTISNGVCPSSSSTVTITRDNFPTVSNAGAAQSICSANYTLNANSPAIGTGAWSVASGTGTFTAASNPTSAVNGISTGANNYVWTISNGTCPSSTSTVAITRDALPTISNAGTDQTICATSYNLNANIPVVGNGAWSLFSGTGSFVLNSNPTSSVNGISIGTNKYVWTISNGTCPSSSSTVTITRDNFPTVSNAGSNQSVCSANYTLNANSPTFGTGAWSIASGTGTFASASNPTSAVNGISTGANTYVWTISNGTCPSSTSTVTITRDNFPTVSNAGTDQTICATDFNLNANVPLVGNGSWLLLSGAGTFALNSSPTSSVSGISVGTNKYVWTITNGVCPSSSSTVTISRDDFPTQSNAGTGETICATNYTLNANLPSTGTGSWSVVSGTGNVSSISNPGSTANNISVGANNFVWTISNGVCPVSSSTVIINRDAQPSISDAGAGTHVCGGNATLNANAPSIGIGNWSFISGNGSFSDALNSAASISNLNAGVNIIAWTITNGVCAPSVDTTTILSDAYPSSADAGSDRTICSTTTDLSAITPLIGTASWSLISGTGNVSSANQNNSLVNNLSIGANVFRWTVINGICPASSDDITITQDIPPSIAVAGPDQEVENPITNLSAVTPSVGSGSWSVIEGDAEILNTTNANTSVSNLSIGNNIIRWTTRNGVCSESTDDIVIYVKPLRIPNGFSPNADGFNDAYVIPSLEFYPNVKFSVFNRWGGAVYESNNYKNDWNGTNLSGEKLSDDTYYYVLDINKKLSFTGFIVLKQNK